jgi:hypothetical protein
MCTANPITRIRFEVAIVRHAVFEGGMAAMADKGGLLM